MIRLAREDFDKLFAEPTRSLGNSYFKPLGGAEIIQSMERERKLAVAARGYFRITSLRKVNIRKFGSHIFQPYFFQIILPRLVIQDLCQVARYLYLTWYRGLDLLEMVSSRNSIQ